MAMKTEEARNFFAEIVAEVKKQHSENLVKEGAFGEYMDCTLSNDGPVTIIVDSRNKNTV